MTAFAQEQAHAQASDVLTAIDHVRRFVEGAETPASFAQRLEQDGALQALLDAEEDIPPYTRDGSLLLYLFWTDLKTPGSALAAQDALAQYLAKAGVPFAADGAAADLYDLLLQAMPRWLSPPESYLATLAELISGLASKAERLTTLKRKIVEDFRCVGKPPRWLQSPDWPFNGTQPLLFAGQIDLRETLHDTAALYVFFDAATGASTVRLQVA